MRVSCRFCGQQIELNEDSEEARAAGSDPYQQLRKHLLLHPLESIGHVRRVGWLVDALAFVPLTEENRWWNHVHGLVAYFAADESLQSTNGLGLKTDN
jgi:hypothetical protein